MPSSSCCDATTIRSTRYADASRAMTPTGRDAAQEALIAIVRGLPRFHGKSKFSTWAYRVATNAALDELRRRSRRPVPAVAETDDRLAGVPTADDPAAVAVRLDLDAALARLPEEFRAPVVLRDVAGCDYAEIGQILRIPPGTVRSRIARGRARLAQLMSANGGNHHDTSQRRNPEAIQRSGNDNVEHKDPEASSRDPGRERGTQSHESSSHE